MKDKIIKLIEANPSLNGRTPPATLQSIRSYYREIYNDNPKEYGVVKRKAYSRKHKSCHGCLIEQLDALRVYVDYPTMKKGLSKKISTERVEICYNCEHSEGKGLFTTCGTPIIGDKEKGLCGCFIHAKVQFKNQKCPIEKW